MSNETQGPTVKPLHWKTRKKLEAAAAAASDALVAAAVVVPPPPVNVEAKQNATPPRFTYSIEEAKRGAKSFVNHTHTLICKFPDGTQRKYAIDRGALSVDDINRLVETR